MNDDKKIKLAHAIEMAEAVMETNMKNIKIMGDYMAKTNPKVKAFEHDRSQIEKGPLYTHFKTSWLLNPEVFAVTLKNKDCVSCKHIDPMNPSPMFYLLGSPKKAILCVKCTGEFGAILEKEFPDRCDLCTTAPHKVFHEVVITAGIVNIIGNICGTCSKTYMVEN